VAAKLCVAPHQPWNAAGDGVNALIAQMLHDAKMIAASAKN
jgi:hypothetical protein